MARRSMRILAAACMVLTSMVQAMVINTPEGFKSRSEMIRRIQQPKVVGYLQETKHSKSTKNFSKDMIKLGGKSYLYFQGKTRPKAAGKVIPIHYFPNLLQSFEPVLVMPELEDSYPLDEEIVIDASESFAPTGAPLIYRWQVLEPAISVTFRQSLFPAGDERLEQPVLRFTPNKIGEYTVNLIVADAAGQTAEQKFSVFVGSSFEVQWSLNGKIIFDSQTNKGSFPYVVIDNYKTPVSIGLLAGLRNGNGQVTYAQDYYWRPVNIELFNYVLIPTFSEWPRVVPTGTPGQMMLTNPELGGYYFFVDSSVDSVQIAKQLYPLEVMTNPKPVQDIEPNLSFRSQRSWGLEAVNADEAWEITRGNKEVKVAVIDTGVDYLHQDLIPTLLWDENSEFVGKNTIDPSVRPFDNHGHGSHCAGIIAGAGSDDGVIGIAPGVTILPYKALSGTGGGSSLSLVRAIYQAVNDGADIISASWGMSAIGVPESELDLLRSAIEYAEAHDVPFVVAAGNEAAYVNGLHDKEVPVPVWFRTSNMIAVAATTKEGELADFSNFGPLVDVAAPGHLILSDAALNSKGVKTVTFSGTSMATPLVAGIVALMKSVNPNLTSSEIQQILIETSNQSPEMHRRVRANGIVNAFAAVQAAQDLL